MPNSCRLETQKFVLNCEIQRADKWLDDITLNHLITNMVRFVNDIIPPESAPLREKQLHTVFQRLSWTVN